MSSISFPQVSMLVDSFSKKIEKPKAFMTALGQATPEELSLIEDFLSSGELLDRKYNPRKPTLIRVMQAMPGKLRMCKVSKKLFRGTLYKPLPVGKTFSRKLCHHSRTGFQHLWKPVKGEIFTDINLLGTFLAEVVVGSRAKFQPGVKLAIPVLLNDRVQVFILEYSEIFDSFSLYAECVLEPQTIGNNFKTAYYNFFTKNVLSGIIMPE